MNWIVTTDMDGTLLNHEDYRWKPVRPCLDSLEQCGIPVILNTSKTFAEVEEWVNTLGISHPFIIENGSAIYCPKGYFRTEILAEIPAAIVETDSYDVIQLGRPLAELRSFKQQYAPHLESLAECSLARAIELTGLTETEAQAAQKRSYSLPLVIESSTDLDELKDLARSRNLQILSGGRFAHLMGSCDKGKAIRYFCAMHAQQTQQQSQLIALGDSGNDRAMLAIADHAILVRNYKNDWLEMTGDSIYRTSQQAPEGWVEGINAVLSNDDKSLKELI